MIVNGFALETIADDVEIEWWSSIPARIELPSGDVIFAAPVGWHDDDYQVIQKAHVVDDPPSVRRMVSKADIISRLTDAQLDAAIAGMTSRQRERWRMPGYPAVYADDPEVIGLITAIGADVTVVLA